jgi:DNA end-binding protein Ku
MTLAVLRVRDGVVVLQTLLWADEVRTPEFDFLSEETHATDKELAMAASLVDSLSGDYEPEEFEDDYAEAVETLVASKIEGGEVKEAPAAKGEETEVIDLLAALQRSVDKAKAAKRGSDIQEPATSEAEDVEEEATGTESAAPRSAKKAAAKTTAKTTARTTTKKAAAKKTAAKSSAKSTTKKAASKATTKKAASTRSKAS